MGRHHKIGMSKDPDGRAVTLGIMPEPVVMLHRIPTPKPRLLESLLHRRFKAARVRGEWFTLNEEDVAAIRSLAEWDGIAPLPVNLEPPALPCQPPIVRGDWPETAFGPRLRELREKAGLTQQQLADAMGVHVISVARLEAGRQVPAWPVVLAAARAFGVPCTAFVGEAGESKRAEKRPRGRPRKSPPPPAE